MESRIQCVLVGVACLWLAQPALAAKPRPEDLNLEPLVVREPERRSVDVDRIDSENIEVGAFGGLMNVEDFGTNSVYGVRLAYHVTESFFVEGMYGRTRLGETSFERLSGGAQILTDDQRDFSYYNVSVGYNVFPGEAFVGRHWAFKGGLYLVGGAGASDFADDQRFTINLGMGYRLALTDAVALHLDVRDHIFETDLLGESRTTHNVELSGGLTVFF